MHRAFHKIVKPIFFIALAIYLLEQGIGWFRAAGPQSFSDELKIFGMYLLYSAVIGLSNIAVVVILDKFFAWDTEPQKRAIYGIIGAILVTMLCILLIRITTVMGFQGQSWNYFVIHESVLTYTFTFLLSMVIVLGFYSYYFFKEISQKAIQKHQVVAKTESAKFEGLKSQIDPHFLFNSLNVLTSLIGENPPKAEQFTTHLSQIYRYVLEQKDKDLVPLEEELRFARIYMELLKMRFENAIQYQLPETLTKSNYKILPLSLQLVLENAVKHNTISEEQPLRIEIKEEDGYLIVRNNLNEKRIMRKGTGVGLKNINERYALLTHKKMSIQKEETHFVISLPLLTQISKIMKTNETNRENKYIRARHKVDKMKDFYGSLAAYLIVIPALAFINYRTYWDFKWFFFPMIGWGIGLLFGYLDAYGYDWFLGKNWEEKKIKEYMEQKEEQKWE